MRVLLISHPSYRPQRPDFPPIGIAYLGAAVRDRVHEVFLIDGELTGIEGIVDEARRLGPDVVGITCWTINRGTVWELCRILKMVLPKAFLVLGGQHASIYPDHIFEKTHAGAVVIGEGEETLCELLEVLEKGGDLAAVRGIKYRTGEGAIHSTEPRPHIEDLDTIPFPYYGGFRNFELRQYGGFAGLPRPTAAVITSRGCVFNCSYCGSVRFWGKKWRRRSASNVLDEMEHLVRDLGARSIFMFDDNFPVNRKRAMEVCTGIIERDLGVPWACCSHVKMVNEELLDIMKKSGCVSIDFGVESGDNGILRNINKNQTREDIERAFALVHGAGIRPRAYLMVGNTGETAGTIDETIEMIGNIKPYSSIGASILWLLPGTDVFREASKRGLIDDSYWLRSDDMPYNIQEHTYKELLELRHRLMRGIARKKGGIAPLVSFYLKTIYYRYPSLSRMRSLIPDWLR